jgi:hypothetical protein
MAAEAEQGRSGGATIAPDTRWMTYREAAEFLGMKEESARRRAQREGWPRQLGNDGRTRVGVPGDAAPSDHGSSGVTDAGDDHPGETAALREALTRERERADRAEARADRAEGHATAERARADTAEREREAARIAEATAVGEGRALRERAERAEAERAATLTELEAWTAGGPLARAMRALLYKRGRP